MVRWKARCDCGEGVHEVWWQAEPLIVRGGDAPSNYVVECWRDYMAAQFNRRSS